MKKHVCITLSPEALEKLRKFAEKNGIPLSTAVNILAMKLK